MKMFTKLALVSSMAISANAMAMQAMDDAALSAATGQDGISIGIAVGAAGITIDNLYIHDNDGLQTSTGIVGATGDATTTSSGAISVAGVTVTQSGTGNLLDLVIDSDAGTGNTVGTGPNSTAFLNIAATVGAVDVSIGSIGCHMAGPVTILIIPVYQVLDSWPRFSAGPGRPLPWRDKKSQCPIPVRYFPLNRLPRSTVLDLCAPAR